MQRLSKPHPSPNKPMPHPPVKPSAIVPSRASANAGMLQEFFNLEEGLVTVTFPESLCSASYEDLQDYFDLFLRKAKEQIA